MIPWVFVSISVSCLTSFLGSVGIKPVLQLYSSSIVGEMLYIRRLHIMTGIRDTFIRSISDGQCESSFRHGRHVANASSSFKRLIMVLMVMLYDFLTMKFMCTSDGVQQHPCCKPWGGVDAYILGEYTSLSLSHQGWWHYSHWSRLLWSSAPGHM